MAVSDERQWLMPTFEDHEKGSSSGSGSLKLSSFELLTEPVGFWMITPSNEFRNGGPVKQDLTSHAGPVTLSLGEVYGSDG
ncbi:hypothetical protein HanPSC8_Chr04g0169931 [Helianthus annuus]|nr:hypothetical protein HanPSC8_Chr04g0169931 [Helianthus annuus]